MFYNFLIVWVNVVALKRNYPSYIFKPVFSRFFIKQHSALFGIK